MKQTHKQTLIKKTIKEWKRALSYGWNSCHEHETFRTESYTKRKGGGGRGCTKLNENKVKIRITSKKRFKKVFEKMNNNNQWVRSEWQEMNMKMKKWMRMTKHVNNMKNHIHQVLFLKSFTNTIYKTTSTNRKVKLSMKSQGILCSWRRRLCTNNCCTMLP